MNIKKKIFLAVCVVTVASVLLPTLLAVASSIRSDQDVEKANSSEIFSPMMKVDFPINAIGDSILAFTPPDPHGYIEVVDSTLVKTTDLSLFSPPSPDPAGIAYRSTTNSLVITDSEVNEIPTLFTGMNVFTTTLGGDFIEASSTMDFSDEPTGVAYDPNNSHLFVTDDGTRSVYIIDLGPDGMLDPPADPTPDDTVTSFSTSAFGCFDPEDITYDSLLGHLFVLEGLEGEVYEVNPGPNLIFDGVSPDGDDTVTNFDVDGMGVDDPEGIAYNSDIDILFILSSRADVIAEVSREGELLRYIDLGSWNPTKPSSLTYAPSSTNPSEMHLYIVDRGWDNDTDPDENDGKLYEVAFPILDLNANRAPSVEASSDQTISLSESAILEAEVIDDGKPDPPAAVTTIWSKAAGPGTVTFADPSALNTTATFSSAGTYTLAITADDSDLTDADSVVITVTGFDGETTTQTRVNASSDDAEENPAGFVSLSNTDLELVFDGGGNQVVGIRFNDVQLPHGIGITNSYVQFQVDETVSVATTLMIEGEAVDNATTFTIATGDISTRTRTTASATWTPPAWTVAGEAGPDQQTSDISTIIQEIADRPGWAAGNSLVLIFSGTGERVAEAFDGDSEGAPLLVVEYQNDPSINILPTVDAGTDQEITLPGSATLDGTVSDDGLPDPPAAVTTTWSMTSGPGLVFFTDPGAVDTTATFSIDGTYVLRLTADDDMLSAFDELTVTVGPANQAPTVDAGTDQTISLPNSATLDGTVSDDGLPDPPAAVTTTWSQFSGPGTVTFGDASAVDTTASFSTEGTYVLRLTADDGEFTPFDELTVTVGPANQAPTVDAGTDQTINLPNSATLDGTVSDDGLPNPPAAVTTTWSQFSGPGTVTFGDASAVDTTASFSTDGTYVLRLTADDGEFAPFDELTVTVGPANQAPTVDAGTDQTINLPDSATLDGTISDDDLPDPPAAVTTTWSMTSGPGLVFFTDPGAVDTNATFSTDGTYVLRLTADDGEFAPFDELTVTVGPANQAPTVGAGPNQTITLPDSAILDGTVSDDGLPNPPAAVTTTWSQFSGPGTVTFGDASAVDTTASFSTDGTYVLRLTADDGEYAPYDEVTVFVNQAPTEPPGQPVPIAPMGEITDNTPLYKWNEVAAATDYLVIAKNADSDTWVYWQWLDAGPICSGGVCEIEQDITLEDGNHWWAVVAQNIAGVGPWSTVLEFRVNTGVATEPPGKPVPIAPIGEITENTPFYQWNEVATATDYLVITKNADTDTWMYWQWLSASSVCSAGVCEVQQDITLDDGNHWWAVVAQNSAGIGPWSTVLEFQVNTGVAIEPPGQPVPIAPMGEITENTPIYQWNEVATATDYLVIAKNADTDTWMYWQWLSAGSVCSAGICEVQQDITLTDGNHWWAVVAQNSAGVGPWSMEVAFRVNTGIATEPPGQPVPIAPMGEITENTPFYQWNEVSTATDYLVIAKNADTDTWMYWQWLSAGSVCSAGVCEVQQDITLDDGNHWWAVVAQNSVGVGHWTAEIEFRVSP